MDYDGFGLMPSAVLYELLIQHNFRVSKTKHDLEYVALFLGVCCGAGSGIRTHEGLRHGIAHPRASACAHANLECSARGQA